MLYYTCQDPVIHSLDLMIQIKITLTIGISSLDCDHLGSYDLDPYYAAHDPLDQKIQLDHVIFIWNHVEPISIID